ncbi:hypothetical protein Q3G72_032921 [Acer saccharum]|nr:hypothetical protein Q3G72_032921 [Acer saccharum]
MAIKEINHVLLSFLCLILVIEHSYSTTDRLLQGQHLKNEDKLVSNYGNFTLGFFSLPDSTDRYLGIWYSRPEGKTTLYRQQDDFYGTDVPVWVANRNTPMLDQSGILAIDNTDGNLKIFLQGRNPIAVSSVKGARNTSATLLQSGNLVLHEINSDGSAKRLLWQSFDYPTDTLLPVWVFFACFGACLGLLVLVVAQPLVVVLLLWLCVFLLL